MPGNKLSSPIGHGQGANNLLRPGEKVAFLALDKVGHVTGANYTVDGVMLD